VTEGTTIGDRIVVDTDVFSYMFRKDTRADFFRPMLTGKTLALSFMSVAELYYGALIASWGADRLSSLENTMKNFVVLPYNSLCCRKWADLRRTCENAGQPLGHADLWIAACALVHGCAVATNNSSHFRHVPGLKVISPNML
jgi:tRNA(fMet)-specific endonuclease VapC